MSDRRLRRPVPQVVLFDVQQRTVLGELSVPFVKYVVWSADMSAVALLSKHAIIIANKRLGNACTVHETIRVKVSTPFWNVCPRRMYVLG